MDFNPRQGPSRRGSSPLEEPPEPTPDDAPAITEVPESPAVTTGRTIPLANMDIDPSPQLKSASAKSKRSRPTTPLTGRPSSAKKNRTSKYPNMKYFTEDGTDGINPPSPPEENKDEGEGGDSIIAKMLENPPSQLYALPTSTPTSTKSLPAMKSEPKPRPRKTNPRVEELIEISSDSEPSTPEAPRWTKMEKALSEPRAPRQFLSPDLKLKNKGRGRYSLSAVKCFPAQ
jgi:hypothetical protein